LRWQLDDCCPAAWWEHLERCGGGFFHTAPGLVAAGASGDPMFARLWHGHEVVGVAAGVRQRCRFGGARQPRHVYFPTVPAIVCRPRRHETLASLIAALRAAGAAEVVVDSFDAGWRPELVRGAAETRQRLEFVVPLEPDAEEMARRCSKHHRRHLQRGERDGWTLRILDGSEAHALLAAVQREAATRAAARGDPFEAAQPPAASAGDDGGHWGSMTCSAWSGGTPLAAALVGWANHRAFYLVGGSTAAGYERDAAQWLHWRIMCHLADEGFTAYNLGGTPGSAALPTDPAHGLYRFKTGFGAEIIALRNARWTLRPAHVGAHRVVGWMAAHLRR
jgi:hypothetical protein